MKKEKAKPEEPPEKLIRDVAAAVFRIEDRMEEVLRIVKSIQKRDS